MQLRCPVGLAPIAVLSLVAALHAQGGDTCSAPTFISGPGTFPVSNVGATNGTPDSAGCVNTQLDVWFLWTSTQTGTARVQFCGLTTTDTVLAVWADNNGGACPSGTAVACNDDSCGLQSLVSFPATAGQTFFIQAGAFGAATTYTASMLVDYAAPPPPPPAHDDCATPLVLTAGPGTFAFDTTSTTTGAEGQANAACNSGGSTAIQRDLWYSWTATTTEHVAVSTCSLTAVNTKLAVYAGTGCPTGAPIACNDTSCGNQARVDLDVVAGNTYTVQLGVGAAAAGGPGQFSIGTFVPPPPCGTNVGPDVIVGDVTDVLNVASVGGIDAVALGTTSCNIGTQVLLWQANTPNHPVIRQNVYKYKIVDGAGRMEQLGASWLKHAFAAVSGSLCCTCQGGGGGLGVGCSDPYGSGLNGNQTSAGPNWQVNAHTGVFPYPPANPAWAGAIARRCQIPVSALEATGSTTTARFFGEGHYVTPDDAAAGNQNNNASWREMACTGTTEFSLSFTGVTNRTQPAIRAWASAESGVTLNDVQIPGDGLCIVGSKATHLGGGTWHYEYAVYNMNADRNVGSFTVPVPIGVNVTNIGFHDIAYHDGDGNGSVTFSGADWIGTLGAGSITWACAAQAVDANANAIRWGTMYNFRFDADVPPVTGALTLGLWKPGLPADVATTGDVPANSAFTAMCLGDGSGAACPCGNTGAPGHGCANSGFASGARLTGSGTASVAGDTARLDASSMTSGVCIFFQGDAQMAPVIVDDGLGCVTGSIVRLELQGVAGGASSYPAPGDLPISLRGAVNPAGGTYYYQCFYRNPSTVFCPPATSNRTNGVAILWIP
ncbi:MAG: hypothetical protein IPJ77_19885 [Planctomycetes bacterium]|nr:hypothetical protein [Planctomycetota bacterium]